MNIELFNFSLNLLQAILWQYNDSPRIQTLITEKSNWYADNEEQFWNDWVVNVFDLRTANTFGLCVWSIILDIPLYINVNSIDPDGKPLIGFNEYTVFPDLINTYVNFENGNFSNRNSVINLTIEEQRLILRLRYYQLVSRGAIPEINTFLKELFQNFGTVYVLDGLDMSIVYVFNFDLSSSIFYVLTQLDLLPRPAGVKIRYRILNGQIFGFNEVIVFPDYININNNFENSNFFPDYLNGG